MATKPTVTVPEGPAPSSLVMDDLVVGDGAVAEAGDKVSVHYVGVLHANGKEFDTSYKRPGTFSFPLGAGRVIPGWDQGVAGMKVGGRRMLTIPPHLGYGARGAGRDIPPNAALVFVVDLIGTQKPVIKPTVEISAGPAPTTLVMTDLVVGEGAEAKPGQNVEVHYVGVLHANGKEFDASYNNGDTFEFKLGAQQVISGWDKGVAGMKVGGRRVLTIPPAMGYGSRGAGGVIPPNATLVFVVDLVGVG